ncbi:MAG: hypothetical protein ACTSQP_17940 [Promethearchaeota archaeon]
MRKQKITVTLIWIDIPIANPFKIKGSENFNSHFLKREIIDIPNIEITKKIEKNIKPLINI